MARKVVVAVDGDTPQTVALLEWVASNVNLSGSTAAPAAGTDASHAVADAGAADASGVTPVPTDAGLTILHAMLPSQVPDWGFYPLYQADKLWEGTCQRGGGIGYSLSPWGTGVLFTHLFLLLPPPLSFFLDGLLSCEHC